MRGKDGLIADINPKLGITPAYAGKRYEEMLQQAGR